MYITSEGLLFLFFLKSRIFCFLFVYSRLHMDNASLCGLKWYTLYKFSVDFFIIDTLA